MNPISFISSSSAAGRSDFATPGIRRGTSDAPENRPATRAADQLELSDRFRRTFDETPVAAPDSAESAEPIRHDLVSRIRAEIASGTYETPDKAVIASHLLARELDITA